MSKQITKQQLQKTNISHKINSETQCSWKFMDVPAFPRI